MVEAIPMYTSAGQVTAEEISTLEPILREAMFEEHRITYPEEKFHRYFAPFFLGVFEVPPGQNLLMSWVSEVGSYHVEVDVIDPTGKVVFTVPPIFNTDQLSLKENSTSRIRFNSLENILAQDSMNNPEGAMVDYYNGISMKLNSMFQGFSTDPNNVAKWLRIYQYYNVKPPTSEDPTPLLQQHPGPAGNGTVPVNGTGIDTDWSKDLNFGFGSGL